MFISHRFTRLLLGLLLAALLGVGFSAAHSKPALAAGGCNANQVVLNSDTKVQKVSIPNGSYTITVHTVLFYQFCDLGAETDVTLSQCQNTALSGCTDTGTATAYLVGTNGAQLASITRTITLSAPFLGSSPTLQSFSPTVTVTCGAAGGTYTGSAGEHILSGSAQRCV